MKKTQHTIRPTLWSIQETEDDIPQNSGLREGEQTANTDGDLNISDWVGLRI